MNVPEAGAASEERKKRKRGDTRGDEMPRDSFRHEREVAVARKLSVCNT